MEKIFLDANIVIDIVEERKNILLEDFSNFKVYFSPLSIHILTYLYKYKIPSTKILCLKEYSIFVPFTDDITYKSLLGPTNDFEDNVQLHSAAEAQCDWFITSDRKLLEMKFFGKMQIASTLK